jgi:hypothetical protein
MKYTVEMSSDAIVCTRCHKDLSGIQKFIVENSQTHRQHGDLISLLLFSQNKESRLEVVMTEEDYSVILTVFLFINGNLVKILDV